MEGGHRAIVTGVDRRQEIEAFLAANLAEDDFGRDAYEER